MQFINIEAPPFPHFAYSGYACYRPGDKHKYRKSYPYFNLILVEAGTLYMTVNGESYDVKQNTLLIIPPGITYYGTKICTEKTIFHWFHFSTEKFNLSSQYSPRINRFINHSISYETFSFTLPVFQTLSDSVYNSILDIMKQNETRGVNFYIGEDTILQHNINIFNQQKNFFSILDLLMQKQQVPNNNVIAEQVYQYMITNYADSISIEQLAATFSCHPTHLIRCVKNTYGIPPKQLLIQIRLKQSCNLLISTQKSITDISYEVGFSSSSYFCKQFKSHYRCSPKEYRDNPSDYASAQTNTNSLPHK